MYNQYTGEEVADSIKRYRQEMGIRNNIELERKLLRQLKAIHEQATDDIDDGVDD